MVSKYNVARAVSELSKITRRIDLADKTDMDTVNSKLQELTAQLLKCLEEEDVSLIKSKYKVISINLLTFMLIHGEDLSVFGDMLKFSFNQLDAEHIKYLSKLNTGLLRYIDEDIEALKSCFTNRVYMGLKSDIRKIANYKRENSE